MRSTQGSMDIRLRQNDIRYFHSNFGGLSLVKRIKDEPPYSTTATIRTFPSSIFQIAAPSI